MSVGANPARMHRLPLAQAVLIRECLERLLAGSAFSGSKRCQQFLAFAVDHAIEGDLDSLRERVIGARIFGRPIDYDTASDAIVRVKANEVRKRLAQHYLECPDDTIRIELPSGSYVPEFHTVHVAPKPVPVPVPPLQPGWRPGKRAIWAVTTVAVVLLVAAAALRLSNPPAARELDQFWKPFLETRQPILVCLGQTEYFKISSPLRRQLDRQGATEITAKGSDIARIRDGAVSAGMLYAVLSVSTVLERFGKPSQVVWGSEVRFQDLRDQNVILIGAFNNPWTLEAGRSLRYSFVREDAGDTAHARLKVVDNANPGGGWALPDTNPHSIPVDYAIITRLFDRERGRVIVSAAGLNEFGTEVAGDSLRDPVFWRELTRHTPAGWERKNLQVVLGTRIAGKRPVKARVLATHFW